MLRSRHHGLDFQAPFMVGLPSQATTQPDVSIEISPVGEIAVTSAGAIVAQYKPPGAAGYTIYSVEEGYIFRFHNFCEFYIDAEGTKVSGFAGPRCDEGLVQIIVEGALTAFLLTLRGLAVLHASAVQWGNSTVLVAGRSGVGKSTVTALCCAAGAKFISDDVVALARVGGSVICQGRGYKLRLRKKAMEIADLFASRPAQSITADERLAILPERAPTDSNVVAAVVLPRPSRDQVNVSLSLLSPVPAITHLLVNARIAGLVPGSMQRSLFRTAAALVGQASVVEARVPWGPPFDVGTARELLDQVATLTRSVP